MSFRLAFIPLQVPPQPSLIPSHNGTNAQAQLPIDSTHSLLGARVSGFQVTAILELVSGFPLGVGMMTPVSQVLG
jgi:hypothetical protein